jgi:putative transposase
MIITPKHAHDYPKIVRAIKYNFSVGGDCHRTNLKNEEQSIARHKKGMNPIWQKRYYEHTIRDEKDYLRCLDYIQTNPIKHNLIKENEEWKYKS